MTSLIIKDLSIHTELDAKGMAAVRGGSRGLYPEPVVKMPKSDFQFNAEQMLSQSQDTVVNNGNSSGFVCGITSTVNPDQTGKNTISFG